MSMQTSEEFLIFRNEFTFYCHYIIEKGIDLNHVRDFINNTVFEFFLHKAIIVSEWWVL